jgi:hypothetical protein
MIKHGIIKYVEPRVAGKFSRDFSNDQEGLTGRSLFRAQSNLLHWNNRGYPLALSAFATGITVTGVVQKNMIISALKKTIASENPARKALIHRVERLRLEGINFPFQAWYEGECQPIYAQTKLDMLYSFLFNYETLIVATLITFGALCVASMLQILRHPDIPTH